MATRIHDFINLSDKRRVFGVGDIHGCFDKLEEALKAVDFDPEAGDVLISTGDLVDRGPKSHEAVYWTAKPWFYRVIGNHERMTLDHLNGDSYLHTINGGGWMADMSPEEKEAHATILNDAPMMLTVLTPKGQRIGFVHADLAFRDWQQNIEEPHFQTLCWSRQMVKMLSDPDFVPVIRGIDKVFFGHNAMHNAFSRGNCSWIDTGCGFENGKLTVVDIESFGNIISE